MHNTLGSPYVGRRQGVLPRLQEDVWTHPRLKTGTSKKYTKCIKMVKSEKTGAYVFQTQNILEDEEIKNFFAQK